MVCLNHPDRDAAGICAACGKPLCEECLLKADGAVYCSEICHQRGIASGSRASEVIATGRKSDRQLRKRSFIILIILLLLAGGSWYWYSRNKKSVDRKISKITGSIKKEAGEAVNAGKGAMPQDSKYKREREALVNQ